MKLYCAQSQVVSFVLQWHNLFVTNVDYNVCFIYRDLFGDELKSSDEPQTTESMETRYYMLDFFKILHCDLIIWATT